MNLHDHLTDLVPAVSAAAAIVGGALPTDLPLDVGEAVNDGAPELPGIDARGVTVGITGAFTGRLCLLLAADLADAIEHGPLGAQELADALHLALTDAGTSMAGVELDPPLATGSAVPPAGAGRAWVPLHSGTDHVATLVLAVDDAPAASIHDFTPLDAAPARPASRPMELLGDVEMSVTVELGRTRMLVRDLLALTTGAVVELDRAAGSAVDVLVNNTLIARGEVVVIDEEFAVRITEVVSANGAARPVG